VAVDESAGRVYVSDCGAGEVVVLETDSQRVVQRLVVGSCPENLTLDRESGFLYVGNSGDGTVSVIGLEDLEITATGRVSQGPVLGLAVDSAGGETYVVCLDSPPRRRVTVVEGRSGEVERSLAGGRDRPLSGTYAVTVDTDRGRLYVADGQELLLLDAEDLTLTSVTSVDAVTYSLGLAVDTSNGRVYLVDSAGGALLVLGY
jgi:DNA-binding beta-propeller fold protein YncE